MSLRALCLASLVVAATACSAAAGRGVALYADGRYIEAAEVFERTEGRLSHVGNGERAEYGLYRGLTFLRLDDVQNARQWLAYAASIERNDPGCLSSDDKRSLSRALSDAERRAVEQPDTAPTAQTVAATDDALHLGAVPNGRRSVRQ